MIQVIDQYIRTCISPLSLSPWKDLSTKMKDENNCWVPKSGKIQVTSVAFLWMSHVDRILRADPDLVLTAVVNDGDALQLLGEQ